MLDEEKVSEKEITRLCNMINGIHPDYHMNAEKYYKKIYDQDKRQNEVANKFIEREMFLRYKKPEKMTTKQWPVGATMTLLL